MRTYVYRCEACRHEYEIEQRITDKPISLCPSCGQRKCERLICEPLVIDMGPKTLGTLAEKNTKKAGRYELEARRAAEESSKAAANSTFAQNLTGGKPIKAPKKPWYREANSTTPQQIKKMTAQQQKKFIMEGK